MSCAQSVVETCTILPRKKKTHDKRGHQICKQLAIDLNSQHSDRLGLKDVLQQNKIGLYQSHITDLDEDIISQCTTSLSGAIVLNKNRIPHTCGSTRPAPPNTTSSQNKLTKSQNAYFNIQIACKLDLFCECASVYTKSISVRRAAAGK